MVDTKDCLGRFITFNRQKIDILSKENWEPNSKKEKVFKNLTSSPI